jgi:serine/threonine-protein kinase RsbW
MAHDLMHEGSITIRINADVKEIERLNKLVRQFGELHDVPSRTLYAVNLALDELVTNVLLYGYEEPTGREVTVRIVTAGSELVASVVDEGRPFNPLDAPKPNLDAPLEDRELGGLGIHLVRSLMDHVAYSREEDKNVLTVRKRIR